jgi:hypothetical protein
MVDLTLDAWNAVQPFLPINTYVAAVSGATDLWIRRGTDAQSVPPNFALRIINNKDGLCTAYAINECHRFWDDDETIRRIYAASCPRDGYRPNDLIDTRTYHVAVWSGDDNRWQVAPRHDTKIFLRLASNGNSRHYDAMVPVPQDQKIVDTTTYPNGRAPILSPKINGIDEIVSPQLATTSTTVAPDLAKQLFAGQLIPASYIRERLDAARNALAGNEGEII